ncbi:NAD(P)-binding protein [Martensiomyces pterosporus]|nr:NAD(P)-binding protein [Martensiomyces pterosporus]
MAKLIAVTGATGLQGGSVLAALHASGKYRLRAISRDPAGDKAQELQGKYPGVEWVGADLDNFGSLQEALKGVDAVFGVTQFFQPAIAQRISKGNEDAEFQQGKNLVDAAISAGVSLMIYSSLDSMNQLSHGKYPGVLHFEGKHKIEEYLTSKADRIWPYFINVGYYMENYVQFSRISPEDNTTVEFTMPLKPTTKVPLVDTASDTGPVVGYILDNLEECLGTTVEVSGGYYEAQDMAKAFTEATGKPARYVQIPYDAVGSDELAQMFRGLDEFGLFGGRTEFIERNEEINHRFTTPAQFWEHRGWDGPTK